MATDIPHQRFSFREGIVIGTLCLLLAFSTLIIGDWNPWLIAILFVLTFFLVFVLIRSLEDEYIFPFIRHPAVIILALFLLALLAISFFSKNLYISFHQWLISLGYACVFASGGMLGKYKKLTQPLVLILVSIGSLVAASSVIISLVRGELRSGGLLGNPNVLGGYLIIILPLALWSFATRKGGARKVFAVFLSVIILSLLFSFSYTAWVSGLIVGLIALAFIRPHISRKRVLVILCTFLALCLLLIGARLVITKSITKAFSLGTTISSENVRTSFTQRLAFNQINIRMFADYPFTGSGLGTFQKLYPRYATSLIEQPRYSHNYYLGLLAEGGGLAAALFLVFLVIVIRQFVKFLLTKKGTPEYWLGISLAFGTLAGMAHAAFDFALYFPSVALIFWLVAGLAAGMTHAEREFTPGRGYRVVRGVVVLLAFILFLRALQLFIGGAYSQAATSADSRNDSLLAAQQYEAAFAYDPNPDYLLRAGARELSIDNSEALLSAQHDLNGAMRISPEDYSLLQLQGRVYTAENKLDEAIGAFSRALSYDPILHPDIIYDLASVYHKQGKEARALELVGTALEKYRGVTYSANSNLQRQLARLALLSGQIYLGEGKKGLAKKQFQLSLQFDGTFTDAQQALDGVER